MEKNLHERCAEVLGWTEEECKTFSLQTLREMVRAGGNAPKLVRDMDDAIQSGGYIIGERRKHRRW